MPTRRPARSRPRILVGAAALTIALAGARAIGDIVGPVFLALVLTISLHPIRIWLEQHRLPGLVASIVLLLAAYLVLGLLTLALIVSVAQLAELLPQYEEQLTAVVADAGNTLRSLGVQQEQIDAVVNAIDPGQLVALAGAVLASTLGVLSNLFFLIVLLFFMAFDTNSTRRSLAVLGERMPDLPAALSSFARGARNYMAVAAGFGFVVAVLDGVALAIMGVPGAFVWAVLAFVTNFIPNIGFVIGVIPPALIALLEGGPGLMLAVIVTYSVINFLIQSVIQPRVVGDTVGLTALVHLHVAGVLDLGHRPTRRVARRTAHPARQGTADRNQPPPRLGTAADCGQGRADRAAGAGATQKRSGWDDLVGQR